MALNHLNSKVENIFFSTSLPMKIYFIWQQWFETSLAQLLQNFAPACWCGVNSGVTFLWSLVRLGEFLCDSGALKVECLLTSAIWSYGHEAEAWSIYFSELTVSFKPQGKFFNSLYFEHPWAESAMTYYRLHPKHISQHYKQKRKPQQRYYR